MEPESAHVVITSPPYYGLRDYGAEPLIWDDDPRCDHVWASAARGDRPNRNHVGGSLGADRVSGGRRTNEVGKHGQFCACCTAWLGCLGREPSPEMYVEHLVQIMAQVRRVLRADGTLWVNIADSHAGGGRGGNTMNRPGVKQDTNKGSLTGPAGVPAGAKAKDLLLVPDMLALALRADGWYFRQKIIWEKLNPMPESVESRPTTSHEFIFLLAKSGKAQFWTHRAYSGTRYKPEADYCWIDRANDDLETMKEPPGNWREETYEPERPQGNDRVTGYKRETTGREPELRRRWSRFNLWRGHDYYYDNVAIQEPTRNKRSVWHIATESFKGGHFAAYPKALVEPCILAGSSHKACPVCGAPWYRATTKSSYITRPTTGSPDQKYKVSADRAKGLERVGGHVAVDTITSGWLPTCACKGNDGSARCLVLDPFMGSGTTGVVAAIHGRAYLGLEQKKEYVEMARERIRQEAAQPMMAL